MFPHLSLLLVTVIVVLDYFLPLESVQYTRPSEGRFGPNFFIVERVNDSATATEYNKDDLAPFSSEVIGCPA